MVYPNGDVYENKTSNLKTKIESEQALEWLFLGGIPRLKIDQMIDEGTIEEEHAKWLVDGNGISVEESRINMGYEDYAICAQEGKSHHYTFVREEGPKKLTFHCNYCLRIRVVEVPA